MWSAENVSELAIPFISHFSQLLRCETTIKMYGMLFIGYNEAYFDIPSNCK